MAQALPTIYLNGTLLPRDAATISPFDRGFLYGDGIYEMIACYEGTLFRLDDHLARLERSLAEVRMQNPHDRAGWRKLLTELVAANPAGNMNVYVQVTRGCKPERDHRFPVDTAPTIFAMCQPATGAPQELLEQGLAVITQADIRWARCDIKATSLIANVLLRQTAEDNGAHETLLVRDGMALEFSASSIFVVKNGDVTTTPNSNSILPGVTGLVVREAAAAVGIPVHEAALPLEVLQSADEIWLASTTREVMPVTRLDGNPVGNGKPGAIWRRVYDAFQEIKMTQVMA